MNPVTGLNIGRLVLGALALLAPRLASKVFGLDAQENPQLGYMNRMFGSREVALGGLTLAASGQRRRDLVLTGIAVDAADVVAGVAAGANGSVGRTRAALLVLPAAVAVVVGVRAISQG
ncbi:DUF4267 domain-containing protein [Nocardioides sp. JQ2195]|uniref:DUF4267 domain-containing protein n=1 Tax=Nocardioides sp. JQ2195 TaxID=2592334 RepID=UPI00143E8782|nr:DUF4267 domain-containing protein [Nocardioides sp. JQ2195]QIX26757.1 DUF4267 domain-containing protein [Nocardioides sp. JQ2195]